MASSDPVFKFHSPLLKLIRRRESLDVLVSNNHLDLDLQDIALNHMKIQRHSIREGNECIDECEEHGDEIIKFYCGDHDRFACAVCAALLHRSCKEIGYIPKLSENLLEMEEYKAFKESIDSLAKKSRSIEKDAKDNITAVDMEVKMALCCIHILKKEINNELDTSTEEVIDKVLAFQEASIKTFEDIDKESGALAKEFEELQDKIVYGETKKLTIELFIDMKKHRMTIEHYKGKIAQLQNRKRVNKPEFVRHDDTFRFARDKSRKLAFDFGLDQEYEIFAHKYVYDKEISEVSCIAPLANGTLAVIDTDPLGDTKLKIYDLNRDLVTFSRELTNNTWGLTALSETQFAVAQKGRIEIFSVRDKVDLINEIWNTELGYTPLVYSSSRFIAVLPTYPPSAGIVNLNGEVVETLPTKGNITFKNPRYMAVSQDDAKIYISDVYMKSVTCLTLDGEMKAQYKPNTVTWDPRGVAVSRDGNVYICNSYNDNIHILSPTLEDIGKIDGKEYNIRHPNALAYSAKEHKLYVGMYGAGKIVVVDL